MSHGTSFERKFLKHKIRTGLNKKNLFTRNQIKSFLKNATEEFTLMLLIMNINSIRFSYCLRTPKLKPIIGIKIPKEHLKQPNDTKTLKETPHW